MPVSNWWSILWKTFLYVLFVISLFVRLILIPWFFQSISLFWFGFTKTKYIHGTLPPSLPGRYGDSFIGLWGTLRFHLPLVDLPKCGCLKAFTHLFWESKAFSTRRDEGSPPPHWPKIYSSLFHQERSPSRLIANFLFPPPKRNPPTK